MLTHYQSNWLRCKCMRRLIKYNPIRAGDSLATESSCCQIVSFWHSTYLSFRYMCRSACDIPNLGISLCWNERKKGLLQLRSFTASVSSYTHCNNNWSDDFVIQIRQISILTWISSRNKKGDFILCKPQMAANGCKLIQNNQTSYDLSLTLPVWLH